MNEDKKQLILRYVLYSLLIFVLVVSAFVMAKSKNASKVAVITEPARQYNTGWYYLNEHGEKTLIKSLPAEIPCLMGESASIYHDYVAFEDKYFSFYTHHQNAKVYLNGIELYTFEVTNKPDWIKSFRAFYHFVKLPAVNDGIIRLELTSLVSGHEGEFSNIYIDDKAKILYRYVSDRLDKLLLGAVLFVFGIVVLILGVIFLMNSSGHNKTLVHIAMLAIFTGAWQLEESRSLQFFIGSQSFHWCMEYMLQYCVLYSALLLISDITSVSMQKFTFIFSRAMIFMSVFQMILQFTGILQITQTAILLYLMFFSCCVYMIILIITCIKFSTRIMRLIFVAFMCVSSAIICAIMFFRSNPNSSFQDGQLTIALSCLFFSLSIIVYQKTLEEFEKIHESELYQKLALVDFNTGVASKTAWFYLTEKFDFSKHENQSYCLILFDMNNLKKLNDTYGHIIGDKVINSFCNCMKKAFYDCGSIYRIGGDEFICLLENVSEEKVRKLLGIFDELVNTQTDTELKFTVAYGWCMFVPKSSADFIKAQQTADAQMYENKRKMKELLSSRIE